MATLGPQMETAVCQAPTMALLNLRQAERRTEHSCYHHGKLVKSMVSGITMVQTWALLPPGCDPSFAQVI